MSTLREAAQNILLSMEAFRDAVLNQRGSLEEGVFDNDQTNAILNQFDRDCGNALEDMRAVIAQPDDPLKRLTEISEELGLYVRAADKSVELDDIQILDLSEPFGEFQYGDAQGDKRVAYARAVIAADRAALGGCGMTEDQKAAAYYKAGLLTQAPPFVPSRVLVLREQFGDAPFLGAGVAAGEHDCACNRWGAVNVTARDGRPLGLRLNEFDVVAWMENA